MEPADAKPRKRPRSTDEEARQSLVQARAPCCSSSLPLWLIRSLSIHSHLTRPELKRLAAA